jgi:hypothetical protein
LNAFAKTLSKFRSLPHPARTAIFICGFVWAAGTSLSVILEVHLPATDVFLFKEAGINLATKGRFVASNLPHMLPGQEFIFSYYPPVFPFLFGVWSKILGVGLRQSILFDGLLKTIRTLLLLLLVAPRIGELLKSRFTEKIGIVCLGTVTLMAFLSTDGDRPDELAMIWGLLSWLAWTRRSKRALSGAFLGLSAATSPAAGVFFGLGFIFRFLLKQLKFLDGLFIGTVASVTFAACNLPIYLADRQAFQRFSKQLPLSTIPYVIPFAHGHSWKDFTSSLMSPAQHLLEIGLPYLFCVFVLLVATILLWRERKEEGKLTFASYFWVSLVFVPLSLLVWSLQPFYLWFACLTLTIVILGNLPTNVTKAKTYAVLVLLAYAPIAFREARGWAHAFERGDSAENIQQTLERLVPPGSRVAVTPDQFFTLKKREISNIGYVCENLDQYDYIYVTPVTSSLRTRPNPFPIPCPAKEHCFTLVQDLTTRKIFKIFGFETPYYVRDNGGILYKNTRCLAATIANPQH